MAYNLTPDQTSNLLIKELDKNHSIVKIFNTIRKGLPDKEEWFADDEWKLTAGVSQFEIKTTKNNFTIIKMAAIAAKLKVAEKDKYFHITLGTIPSGEKTKDFKLKIILSKKSGAGGISSADMTAYSESLQCYYLSLLYNDKSNWKRVHNTGRDGYLDANSGVIALPKEMKHSTVTSECFTYKGPKKVGIEECWNAVMDNSTWIEDGVFTKTALAIKASKEGKKFSGTVRFHRGSPFMDEVYARRKRCMDHDKRLAAKKGGKLQAPSSFSNDKWNPGDIWMSTLGATDSNPFPDRPGIWEGNLGVETCDWEALQRAVLLSAYFGITLGVSLKKIGKGKAPTVRAYNEILGKERTSTKLDGFRFGSNGDFFSSSDMYFYFNGGSQKIQFRAFNGTSSWQGEIKGGFANGGKIGGGPTNYYTEKYFQKSIGSAGTVKDNKKNWAETKNPNLGAMYKLYKTWVNAPQYGLSKVGKAVSLKEFKLRCGNGKQDPNNDLEYKNSKGQKAGPSFRFSKNMCLLLLEASKSSNVKVNAVDGGNFGEDIFRYAGSNTDYSSFYIKVS